MGMAAARKQEVSLTTVPVKRKKSGGRGLTRRVGVVFTSCQHGVGRRHRLLCRGRGLLFVSRLQRGILKRGISCGCSVSPSSAPLRSLVEPASDCSAHAGSCFLCSPSFTSIPSRAPQSQSLSGSLWLQLYMCVRDPICVRACVSVSVSVCVRVSVFNVKLSLYAYVRV